MAKQIDVTKIAVVGGAVAIAYFLFKPSDNQNSGGGSSTPLSDVLSSTGEAVQGSGEGFGSLFTGLGNLLLGTGSGLGNAGLGVGTGAGNLALGVGTGAGNALTGGGNLASGVGDLFSKGGTGISVATGGFTTFLQQVTTTEAQLFNQGKTIVSAPFNFGVAVGDVLKRFFESGKNKPSSEIGVQGSGVATLSSANVALVNTGSLISVADSNSNIFTSTNTSNPTSKKSQSVNSSSLPNNVGSNLTNFQRFTNLFSVRNPFASYRR